MSYLVISSTGGHSLSQALKRAICGNPSSLSAATRAWAWQAAWGTAPGPEPRAACSADQHAERPVTPPDETTGGTR